MPRTHRTLLFFAVLALIAWIVRETEPAWRRHWSLYTSPAPTHLPMPVQGVAPRAITDTWHAPRDAGTRQHKGVDIFARRGTPVLSPVEGIVIGRGTDRRGGNVVRVLGPGRQVHYFAHLDAFSDVEPRMWVSPGAVVGFVGDTGNARGTPPHLHYGIYSVGGAVNPYPLLVASSEIGPRPIAAGAAAGLTK